MNEGLALFLILAYCVGDKTGLGIVACFFLFIKIYKMGV